jgi:hypothetical protein
MLDAPRRRIGALDRMRPAQRVPDGVLHRRRLGVGEDASAKHSLFGERCSVRRR